MRHVHLKNIDLNLLTALAALLEERSVTAAAYRVGLSQPAMSRALGRLRDLFDDPLLVRTARSHNLTPRAEAMKHEVFEIMRNISGLLEPEVFDPATSSLKFRFAINDYSGNVLLPRLTAYMREYGFDVELVVHPHNRRTLDLLEAGELDLAVGSFARVPDSYYRQVLFEDHFVCLVRADHEICARRVTAKRYLAQSHLVVSLDMEGSRPVDTALKKRKRARDVKMIVPYFSAVPGVLRNSDMVLTLPHFLAKEFQDETLAIVDLPFNIPPVKVSQMWHPRLNASPSHKWMRGVIKELALQVG